MSVNITAASLLRLSLAVTVFVTRCNHSLGKSSI